MIFFTTILLGLISLVIEAKTTSSHHKLITTNYTKCAAIEIAAPAHKINPSATILLELDLSLNATHIYDSMFGKGASRDESHKANFECMQRYSNKLDRTTDATFESLEQLLNLRNRRFSPSAPKKRDLSIAISVLAALTSLLANVGTSIFFGLSIQELSSNVEYLNNQLDLDATYSKTIAENTKLIAAKENEIAIQTNIISTSFKRFRRVGACTTLKVRLVTF